MFLSPYSQFFGRYPWRGRDGERVVALTFDDGPNEPYTSQIAEVLNDRGVRATFFQVGWCVQRSPATTAALAAAGHVIGNHSLSHRFRTYLRWGAFAGEIERTQEILGQVLGQEPRLVRMPWLWRQPAILSMLARSGLTPVSGLFCHALEVFQIDAARIAARAMAKARAGRDHHLPRRLQRPRRRSRRDGRSRTPDGRWTPRSWIPICHGGSAPGRTGLPPPHHPPQGLTIPTFSRTCHGPAEECAPRGGDEGGVRSTSAAGAAPASSHGPRASPAHRSGRGGCVGRSAGGPARAEHLVQGDGREGAAVDQRDQLVEAAQHGRVVGVAEVDHARLQVFRRLGQQELGGDDLGVGE